MSSPSEASLLRATDLVKRTGQLDYHVLTSAIATAFDADQRRVEKLNNTAGKLLGVVEQHESTIAELEHKLAIAIECIERYPGHRAKDTLSKIAMLEKDEK